MFLRFRCRVGHAFTAAHLDSQQRLAVETSLWAALRALEERASLYSRMAQRAGDAQLDSVCKQYEEIADEKLSQAKALA
jgi:two-component system, chemotaxis family, protein-glutamate methylesterase/glutaminase